LTVYRYSIAPTYLHVPQNILGMRFWTWCDVGLEEGEYKWKLYLCYRKSYYQWGAHWYKILLSVRRLNARPQSVGPTSKLFFQLTCFFWCLIMCISCFCPLVNVFKLKLLLH